MENTLSKINKIYKIAGIVCKVLLVCCIVGVVMFTFSTFVLLIGGGAGQPSLEEILKKYGVTSEMAYSAMILCIVACVGGIVITKMACNYFKNELMDGTPFTMRGANELFHLSIASLVVPFAVALLSSILAAIFVGGKVEVKISIDILPGLVLMFLSLVYRYVAEKEEQGF